MKVLVDLNGCENYSIRIDRTDSAVVLPFNQVYNEIRKQIKHNITKHSHMFEIFDTDFNEYCVIPSDEHVIENLSRLRVRPKTVNNESIGLGINRDSNVGHKNENNMNKCDVSVYSEDMEFDSSVGTNSEINSDSLPAPEPQSPTHPLPPKLAQNNGKWFNVGNGIHKMMNTCSPVSVCPPVVVPNGHSSPAPTQPIKQIVSTPIPSPLTPGSHPSAPINYLDVEPNPTGFTTTASSPHMPYITYTACVGTVWVTGMSFLLADHRAVIRLSMIFKANTGAIDPNAIVIEMTKNGFNRWNYSKCLNYLYNALKLYKKCLANCPNRETADRVYPLFNTMHSFVPYFLMTDKELAQLNESKRLFDEKCGQCCGTTCATVNADTHTVAPVDPPGSSEQNPIDYLGLPVTGKQFTVNTSSPHLPYVTAMVKVRGLWYRTGQFPNAYQLALNRLLQLVDKHRPTDGRPMTEDEWERVAAHMPRIRDCNKLDVVFDSKLCQNYVLNALDLYKKTLDVCPNMDRAGIAFPMFNALYVFSPERVVSDAECRDIKRLRQLFGRTCMTAPYLVDQPLQAVDILGEMPSNSGPKQPRCSKIAELRDLNARCVKITRDYVDAFNHLCHCVGQTVVTVGPFTIDNQELFWSHVSQQMLDSNTDYRLYSNSICRQMFSDHVTKYYKIALKHLPNYTNAVDIYPLFAVIHAMDLSQTISHKSYESIKFLRELFNSKDDNLYIT